MGCRLVSHPEVADFVKHDLNLKYENTLLKTVPGQSPELVLLDEGMEEIQRLDIVDLTRTQLNGILQDVGIPLRDYKPWRKHGHGKKDGL